MEYLAHLEEDNLFRIHLVQEEEQALEKFKKASEEKVKEKHQDIEEVKRNIQLLENSKKVASTKQVFLESNMRVKQGGKNEYVQMQKGEGEERVNSLTMLQ